MYTFLYKEAVDQLSFEEAPLVLPLGVIPAMEVPVCSSRLLWNFGTSSLSECLSMLSERLPCLLSDMHRLSLKFHLERQTGGLEGDRARSGWHPISAAIYPLQYLANADRDYDGHGDSFCAV